MTPATPADADIIGDIAISRVGDALTTKVEIALTKDVPYQVHREGNTLKVSFARKASEASVNVTAPSVRETPISESSLSSTAAAQRARHTLSRTYPVDCFEKIHFCKIHRRRLGESNRFFKRNKGEIHCYYRNHKAC